MSTIYTNSPGPRIARGRKTSGAQSFTAWLRSAMERRKSRSDLLGLTSAQLTDIGLSPEQAHREGIRPFWE